MPSSTCKALTASGEQCRLKAGASGYCHIHDPDKVAERKAARQASTERPQITTVRRFSQRKGFKSVNEVIQTDGMSDELRNSIWNVLSHHVFARYRASLETFSVLVSGRDDLTYHLWTHFYKTPIDRIPNTSEAVFNHVFEWFFGCGWYEVYDFLEFVLSYVGDEELNQAANEILERELSGYRFVSGVITDITDEQEIDMLQSALADPDYPSVRAHLQRALELLSDRENPDYRNSIKESISAVESLACAVTYEPKATLGDALKVLERSGKIHPALKEAFSKLYGYASDEGGIRHAMLEEPTLSAADAKFFLLSCTSFINYVKSKL